MKLLIEQVNEVEFLTEDVGGTKVLHIVGPYLQSEQKNKNGRIYPKTILEREVARYTRDKIDRHCAWGELGHPDGPIVNLDRTAIRIVSLKENGNDWVGKARVQNTPHGNIIKALIADGGVVGVSSRGCGSLKITENAKYVQEDYHLVTGADVVADPSAHDAFVQGLMESKEWVWNNGIVTESDVAQIYNEVKNTKRKNLEEGMIKAFTSFINKL